MSNYFSRSCNALTTGYDRSGMKNYAYSSSVPDFSLTGSKPFSIQTKLCMRSVQRGMIFRQEGVFEMGFENNLLVINAPGICTVKFPKEVMSFIPDIWYVFGVTFDGTKLHVYVDGFEAAVVESTATPIASSGTYYEMGTELEAYIREILLYPVALNAEEIHQSFMNAPARTDACAAWFDFSGDRITERSGKSVPISVKGFAKIVNTCRVLTSGGGIAVYTPFDILHPGKEGYTWTAKIYPQRTANECMCIGANSDAERASGWMLWLQKESDDVFRVCLRTGGTGGAVLTSDKTIGTLGWTDVAWTYDGETVNLYLDGEVAGSTGGIAIEALQGDGRTVFCGVTRKGKIDNKYAYSGYMAYVAEFGKCLNAENLRGYKTNQPYVLDEGITGVFDFTDANLTEKCTLQAFSVSGQAGIAWAENTNLLTDPQTLAFYMPEEDNAYWNSLSEELKWEVELYGTIVNSYLRDGLGYKLDAADERWYCSAAAYIVANGLQTSEFRQIVKDGPHVKQDSICAFGAAVAATGILTVLGGVVGVALKAGIAIGAALASSVVFWALTAVAAVAVIAVIVIAVVETCKRRPANNTIQILSIEFNHNSNPQTGGIHIRQNNEIPIVPPEWVQNVNNENNPACCAYIRGAVVNPYISVDLVFVSENADEHVVVALAAEENGNGILGNCNTGQLNMVANIPLHIDIPIPNAVPLLNGLLDIPVPPANGWWTWTCNLNGEEMFVCNTFHRVYRLLGQPVDPWRCQGEPYNPGELSYPWTTAMDVAAEICATGVANGGGEFLECLAKGLNATPNFRYQGASHYFYPPDPFNPGNYTFYINMFQQNFNDHGHVWAINCSDCSGVVGTYGNLHGVDLNILHLSGNNGNEAVFPCNPIIVIGQAEWAEPGGGDGFVYHQIVAPRGNDFEVTDACLKIDACLYPSQMPDVVEKAPIIACNMLFSNNPDNNQVDIQEPFEDQVYRERLARNGVNCNIWNHINQWLLGNVGGAPVPIEAGMMEYYKRIGEYYKITTDMTVSSELPLILASSLRLDVIPNLVRLGSKNRLCEYPEPFTYKGKQILISIQVCDSVAKAKTSLVYKLGAINYRHIPTAEEMGIELGEKAFIIQDKDGLSTCVLLYRRNVVIYLLCTTTESIDLLPLANALDRQMLEE
jgi:hypothetical protein